MQDLSLHVLDVAENGIKAGADLIRIVIEENPEEDRLMMTISDNGRGMEPEFLARVLDPFVTTRTTRKVGLGLSLLQQTAEEADGCLKVDSKPGQGTRVDVAMNYGHIDRKPMGDMAETIITLIQGNAAVDFAYEHIKNGKKYSLNTAEIRQELEEIPLDNPEVIKIIKGDLDEGLEEIDAGDG
jgi:Histidine kinase-, DNA gyrase B-, and HSP90-like ATPase